MRFVKVVLAAALVWAAAASPAQFFQFNMGRNAPQMADFTGAVSLEPATPVVGIPCAFVFSFSTKNRIEIQQISGLPDVNVEYLSQSVEPYADGKYRLPVRFTGPLKETLTITVGGMQTVETGNGTSFRSSYSTNFRKTLPPFKIDVEPLPEEDKPLDFSGAVGRNFMMTQKLSADHVRPGDLLTATYELTFDGYCPSNIWPKVENLSKEFKAYEPKEVARTANKVTWTQVLVPQTVAATNTALVSVSYYNAPLSRYEAARAYPKKLVFVSAEAASTQNTSVTVAGDQAHATSAASGESAVQAPLELRFAPSAKSPVIATLPPGTPVKERAQINGWRRVETSKAIGWTK